MKILTALLVALLAAFASAQQSASRYHWGVQGYGAFIDIWNLDDVVLVKKQRIYKYSNADGENSDADRIQYLSGGLDMRGWGVGFGLSGSRDLGSHFSLRADLLVSYRDRLADATEHHEKTATIYDDANSEGTRSERQEYTEGSKGKYDVILDYWHLDLPITLRWNGPAQFFVEAGGLFSYIASANLDLDLLSVDFNTYSAGMELGAVGALGKGFTVGNKRLDVFGRFVMGLTPLLSDAVEDYIYKTVYPKEWMIQAGITLWVM